MLEPEAAVPRREDFQNLYASKAPWDIGRPQPVFQAVADSISGSILDAGCGTGENALFFASRGHAVTGFDFLEGPIAMAKQKASERKLRVMFLVKDALQLASWAERFDNIVDSGLFHVFPDPERAQYVRGLRTLLNSGGRLFLLCFSDATPGTQGPRRVSKNELKSAFAEGWKVESIEPAEFETHPEARLARFGGENPKAWFLIARRAE
jgi:SAM-dependent methyltransferase